MGSHIDSVPQGGNYDGQVGSVGAIEVAHTIHERDIETRHPLEVVIFQNEEGGKTGSRAISGEVEAFELDLVTASGKTIGEGIRLLGGDPDRPADARRRPGDIAAYLELHIEQGAILDSRGITIGVVEGIVGIKRWNVTVEGFANHAGTTPMDARRDALVSASAFVQAVNEIARATPGRQVATVGRLEVDPGAPNVVPGRVTLSLEIRDLQMDKIDSVFADIRDAAAAIGAGSDTSIGLEQFYVSHAALTDPRIQRTIAAAAERLGLSALNMPSGAGHDAQSIAQLAPVGMIFVPSVQGISHSPREYSRPADIEAGANVLLHALLDIDDAAWD
jgi:N-carbamoyl-L-amino-acid hydrolase